MRHRKQCARMQCTGIDAPRLASGMAVCATRSTASECLQIPGSNTGVPDKCCIWRQPPPAVQELSPQLTLNVSEYKASLSFIRVGSLAAASESKLSKFPRSPAEKGGQGCKGQVT